jgi:S-adenosylmethionine:tRNA ribosyltransferase-isomerase
LLKAKAFSYELTDDRIAQRPVHPPEAAKLLVYGRADGSIQDSTYDQITSFVRPNDIFVFNNSKVIPARLFGKLQNTNIEILLLKRIQDGQWLCLGKPMKKFIAGAKIDFGAGLSGIIKERTGQKEVLVSFEVDASLSDHNSTIDEKIFEIGNMPIPPYIRGGKSDAQDKLDYQTIFARHDGSIAAPTASLHFSTELKSKMLNFGATIEEVTLHVGAASFLPLWDEVDETPIERPGIELFKYDSKLLEKLNDRKRQGYRVIAVGTTVVRALESMALFSTQTDSSTLHETDLFITPGFEFKVCDDLVTNFHQPKTTHLLLVEAFMGRSALSSIYEHALDSGYRFLSYGDGMIIK